MLLVIAEGNEMLPKAIVLDRLDVISPNAFEADDIDPLPIG